MILFVSPLIYASQSKDIFIRHIPKFSIQFDGMSMSAVEPSQKSKNRTRVTFNQSKANFSFFYFKKISEIFKKIKEKIVEGSEYANNSQMKIVGL